MSLFGRSELGDTDDPVELVPGSVASLDEMARGLRKLSNACQEAYAGVSKTDVGSWTGAAADKFRQYFSEETPRWRDAAEAFGPAAEALTTYQGAVERAQRDAAEAIRLYNEAKQATKEAERQYETEASQREKASLAAQVSGAAPPAPLGPFSDPGKDRREMAERMLADARKALRDAAAQAAAVINKSKDRAPQEPGLLSRIAATVEDTFGKSVEQAMSFGGGLVSSVTSLVKMLRAANPLDPANITHPGQWVANMAQQAAGMVRMVTNPVEAAKGILNIEEWKKDPFAALGRLTGDIAIAVATDGAGAAAIAEKAVVRESIEAGARESVEQASTQIGKRVDDATPDNVPNRGDEPIGSQRTDSDSPAPNDREPGASERGDSDSPAGEQRRIREPDELPQPDKDSYFQLKRSVAEIQDMLPQLSGAELKAQEQLMAQQRQTMRDIMQKYS